MMLLINFPFLMLKVTLTDFKRLDDEYSVLEFECIDYEIEKGLYKFYLSHTEIKFVPYYDFYLDIIYPVEFKIEKK